MGLNLDINQVYFSGLEKFDGKYVRPLNDMEIGQIAGRAGRYTKSGYFGSTLGAKFTNLKSIENIQANKFEPIKKIFWRNHLLSFKSEYDLVNSLKKQPDIHRLILKKDAEDQKFLSRFLKDNKKNFKFNNSVTLKQLWDVCRIPDYQNISDEKHVELLTKIFNELIKNQWVLSDKFLDKEISHLQNYNGSIDDLIYNLNETRTWLYITNQKQWISNSIWVETVKNIENKLSEEIHLSLMQKFVDKNKSEMIQNLNISEKNISLTDNRYVKIKDEKIGVIKGFKIFFDEKYKDILNNNYHKIIKEQIFPHMSFNVDNFIAAPNESFLIDSKVDDNGNFQELYLKWGDANVAIFKKGNDITHPILEPILDNLLVSPDNIRKIQEKIQKWFYETYYSKLNLSDKLKKFNSKPEERSFVFKIIESQYNFYQINILDEFKLIDEPQRKEIHSLNFRLGKNVIFNSELIRPEYMKLKFYLWNLYHNENLNIDEYIPKDGNATLTVNSKLNEELLTFLGFISKNDLLIRLDIFNEFEKQLFKRENRGPFSLPMDLSNLLGIKKDKLISILKSRSFNIHEIAENDLIISKKINANKTLELKQNKNKKVLKKPSKKVKKPSSKKLFNNPFDQLKNINVK